MAESSGGHTFWGRMMIIVYALGLILIAWKPLQKSYGPQIRRIKASVVEQLNWGEPRLKSGPERGVSTPKAAPAQKMAASSSSAKPPADGLTKSDKKELQNVLDNIK